MGKLDRVIADSYTAWHQEGAFLGTSYLHHLGTFCKHVPDYAERKILDFGCGPKGGLAEVYGERVIPYDPFIPAYAVQPWGQEFSVFFSCDVLEHMPEAALATLFDGLRQRAGLEYLFAAVSTRPAHKFLNNGLNAHLSIKPPEWWVGLVTGGLGSHFELARAKCDLVDGDLVLVLARRGLEPPAP